MSVRIFGVLALFSASSIFGEVEHETAEGLQLTRAVSSKLVEAGLLRFPMMATLDDHGRLFVAESRGTNLSKEELLARKPGLIRLLEDTDADGVFDKATVYADNLTFPQGALWIYDSLYVMSPPSLWRLSDFDHNGRAEVREELATGFDFTGNAADVHGPFLHPNGRLFWCHGRKGYAVPDSDTGEVVHRGKGARIWSSTLSGGETEPFAGGGMDNPVELDFTGRGEIIGTVNLFHGRPRGDTLTHWIHGGVYPRVDQPAALEGLPRTGPLLPEVHNFGHAAISGMCRYRSGLLNPEWKDQWLVSHFNTARITRTRLVREGSSFVPAETETVLELKDPDAHFTDVLEDANGDLLVIDTGGWFRNGCPTSHLAKPEQKGMIYRLSRRGIPYTPASRPAWTRLTAEQVSSYLDSEIPALRDRAILELAERGDPSIPELRRLLHDPASTVETRRNAIWSLSRMKFSESIDLIYDALVDPAPSVRQAAANAMGVTRSWQSIAANQPSEREIELERNRTISGALARIVRGDEPAVAREAAAALGRMAETRAMGAILGRLGRVESDSFLRHSLIRALIDMDDPESTRQGLESENPLVISGVIQALSEMPTGSLEILDALPHLDSPSADLRATVIGIAKNSPSWDAALANRFFEWEEDMNGIRRTVTAELVPVFADSPPMRPIITSYLEGDAEKQERALHWLTESDFGALDPDWEPPLRRIVETGPRSPLFEPVVEVLSLQSGDLLREELDRWIEDESIPTLLRVKMLRAQSGRDRRITDNAFSLLLSVLSPPSSVEAGKDNLPATRMKSLELLAQASLTSDQRTSLARKAPHFSYPELARLMTIFRKIESPEQAEALAQAITESTGFSRFDPDRLRQLFRPLGGEAFAAIERRVAKLEEEEEKRAGRLESFLDQIPKADPERGKELFLAGAGTCIVCHRVGEHGNPVGPDLSAIGRIRNARDLLESVLYPDVSIARDFETVEVIEKGPDGISRVGIIGENGIDALSLVDAAAQKTRISHSRIDSIVPVETSLMPPGLDALFREGELADLVAFLLLQQGNTPEAGVE